MAIPETPTAATPPSLKPTRTPAQAWTRFAQVMSFMLILGSLAFGIFVSVEGSGGLISETWGFLKVIFYLRFTKSTTCCSRPAAAVRHR